MRDGSTTVDAVRPHLVRHPVAVDCARTVAAIERARCDVIVFEDNRAFVVASSTPSDVLQPRRLTPSELGVRRGDGLNTGPTCTSVGFVDGTGTVVGAITAWTQRSSMPERAWHGFSRMITAGLGDRARDTAFSDAVAQGLRDAVIVLGPDLEVVWTNDAIGSLIGRTPAETQGRSALDFLHPDDVDLTADAVSRMQQGLEMYRLVVRLHNADGGWTPVEVTGVDHTSNPTIGGLVLSLRYANHDTELGATMDRVERVSKAIVSGLREGIVATDQFGAVTVVNDVAREMFGIGGDVPASALTLGDFELLERGGRRRHLQIDAAAGLATADGRIITSDGETRYVTTNAQSVIDDAGEFIGNVVAFQDVTSEHIARQELIELALHDQLTGLANRRQLDARLGEISTAHPAVDVAACFIDLDGFKLVNDNYGHRTGDTLIRIAAERLQRQLRRHDLLVRHGGDEFVALLVGVTSVDAAVTTAERCRTVLCEPYQIGDDRFDLTASIGVGIASSEDAHTGVLLQHADIALYAAKHRGRNRVEQFDASLADAVGEEQRQRELLRAALDSDRLVMHYQPLIDAETGRTVGYEALARITMEDGSIIGPGSFIAAISNSGLMWELDQTAFSLACEAVGLLGDSTDGPAPYVACNFSSISLTHPHFLNVVDRTLAASGADPSRLCIEITESAAFEAGELGVRVLNELSDRGIMIALDDFGTGYSSLAHLRDLPISAVKVDRSFIGRLGEHHGERAIAEAIVTLARELELGTVAEGVETSAHVAHAQELGFATLQGWHYAKAMPLGQCLSDANEHPAATSELCEEIATRSAALVSGDRRRTMPT